MGRRKWVCKLVVGWVYFVLKITHLAPSLTRTSHLLVVLFHTVTSYLDTNTDSACYYQTFLQSIKSESMFTYNFGYFLIKQCRDLIKECVHLNLKETRVIKDFTPKFQKWENRGLKKINIGNQTIRKKLLSCEGIREFALFEGPSSSLRKLLLK